MTHKHDPVDDVLDCLGGRSWPQGHDNNKLKERIMQDLRSNASVSRFGRRGTLMAALAMVILGTAGFAAAGGLELVRGWFVTVEVNGVPVEVDDANIDIQTDGEMATITIDGLEVPEGDFEEGQVVTVTAIATPTEGGGNVVVKEVSGNAKASGASRSGKDKDE